MSRFHLTILASCVSALALLGRTAGAEPSQEAFLKDLKALTANPHRLAGRADGSLAAAKYVHNRLVEMGFREDQVFLQDFPLIQPTTVQCHLIVDGNSYDIKAMRPNVLQAPTTPEEGLSGPTVYVGRGEVPNYGSVYPEGKIVVMDMDCDLNWLSAFAFGARAVLFVGPGPGDTPDIRALHHVNVPANLPRFYVPYELASRLDLLDKDRPRQVKILAACQWEELRGKNVIAVIRGTKAVFDKDRPPQAIVLAAPLDSLSEAPEVSPGARDAANCAALLQLAQYLRENPPRRDVILCFFDGQTLNHMGARAFYGALYRRIEKNKLADITLDERLEDLGDEQAYFKQVLTILEQEELFGPQTKNMKYHDDAIRLLRDEARTIGNSFLEKVSPKRILRVGLDRELKDTQKDLEKAGIPDSEKQSLRGKVAELEARIGQLDKQIEALNRADMGWNAVQRDLHKGRITPESKERFAKLAEVGRQLCKRRLAELERLTAEANVAKRLYDAVGPKQNMIVLHLSVNLGDARSRWTFIHGDDSAPLDQDSLGNYTPIFKTMREVARDLGDSTGEFDLRAISPAYENRSFAPGRFIDSGAVARWFALFNLSAMTVLDRLPRQGLPTDTLEALNWQAMFWQVNQIAPFVKRLADHPGMNLPPKTRPDARYADASWTGVKSNGPQIRRAGMAGAVRAQYIRDAFVAVMRQNGWNDPLVAVTVSPPGFIDPLLYKTNIHGVFEPGPYSQTFYRNSVVVAVLFDRIPVGEAEVPDTYTSRGLISSITSADRLVHEDPSKTSVNVFDTVLKTFVGYGFSRGALGTAAMRALSTAAFPRDRQLVCEWSNILTVFAPVDATGLKLFNAAGLVALRNTNDKEGYQGRGISLENPFDHPTCQPTSAHDLRTLNAYRLKLLREVRIHQESLEVLAGQAEDLESDAEAHKAKTSVDQYYGPLAAATAFSRLVYGPLRGVMNDLVTAVVLLLLLAMPFAYALERLLIGTPHIYRQIGWFGAFFAATFGLLFAINPAFRIASTPIIIFLAFAIILLSTLVIFIMVRKLQTEIRKMQGLATTVHSADVSRLSTMMAAVNMGISTMRRRPLRTLLTAATVVLLTFTILTFASFGSSWGIWQTYQCPLGTSPPQLLVRHPLWSPIDESICNMLRGFLGGRARVVPRYWVSPTAQQARDAASTGISLDRLIANGTAQRLSPISAAIGLDPADLKDEQGRTRHEQLADLFRAGSRMDLLDKDGIFLTEAVANELKLTPDDIGKGKVLFSGMEFVFAGLVEDRIATFTLLEGSDMLPVDYEASGGESVDTLAKQSSRAVTELPDIESAQFVTYNIDKVVILSSAMAKRLGGTIRSITIYPLGGKTEGIRDMGRDVAKTAYLPAYVGDQDGVHRLIFTSLAKASGWRDLLVPVVLGGLIIFATMLGSVSDREREIYTFSSLGLAPPHVASLFFAEASMYAVLGGMGGYLLGQAIARLMGWLSAQFGWSVPPMNYSSTNAITTVLIVMFTVLVSTAYPALKASRSANPGVQRTWQIPKPKGNLYDLVFPFTVSAYDITGVVSFLKEHFENYTDTSLGVFATTSCGMFRQKGNNMLGFRATVALAPFDLGVNQHFAMLSQPSDIQGIDEVRILIYRLSGAQGDWQRSNRVFVNDLRRQLLIWRSLPNETMDKYRQKTLEAWNELPEEQIDPQSIGVPA
jgi:hypothetical protein